MLLLPQGGTDNTDIPLSMHSRGFKLSLAMVDPAISENPKPATREVDLGDPKVRALVAKILSARFYRGCQKDDFPDLLQEVFCTLIRKNGTPGGWQPSRAGLSTYVFQVCRSVASHESRKRNRMKCQGEPGISGDVAVTAIDRESVSPLDTIEVRENLLAVWSWLGNRLGNRPESARERAEADSYARMQDLFGG